MGLEIERKFLIKEKLFNPTSKPAIIKQGFLSDDPDRSVRIRITDNKGFITIKGRYDAAGLSRFEFEKEILHDEALDLLKLCKNIIIEKRRYNIKVVNHIFEVDIFQKENEGLMVAEVELDDIHENFDIPEWLGKEVTGDPKYYNLRLSEKPFKTW